MGKQHQYRVDVTWTGDRGSGTSNYHAYDRDHVIVVRGKPEIPGSSDPSFRGDPERWNPEELLVAALSACHKLWYLHLCAVNGITVRAYRDQAEGIMNEWEEGGGCFAHVTLKPVVEIGDQDDAQLAEELHQEAHRKCFIANSVSFPVNCEPVFLSQPQD